VSDPLTEAVALHENDEVLETMREIEVDSDRGREREALVDDSSEEDREGVGGGVIVRVMLLVTVPVSDRDQCDVADFDSESSAEPLRVGVGGGVIVDDELWEKLLLTVNDVEVDRVSGALADAVSEVNGDNEGVGVGGGVMVAVTLVENEKVVDCDDSKVTDSELESWSETDVDGCPFTIAMRVISTKPNQHEDCLKHNKRC
jgi:hypothetical protein